MSVTTPAKRPPARHGTFAGKRRPDLARTVPHWRVPVAPAGWSATDCRQAAGRLELASRQLAALPASASAAEIAAMAGEVRHLVDIDASMTRREVAEALALAGDRLLCAAVALRRAARGRRRQAG